MPETPMTLPSYLAAEERRIADQFPHLPDPGAEPETGRAWVTITAGYPGKCADCGDPFLAGATITVDPDGHGWVADCCVVGGAR